MSRVDHLQPDADGNGGAGDASGEGRSASPTPPPAAGGPFRRRRRFAARLVGGAAWAYLLLAAAACPFVRYAGERWWPATLLLLGPRWACAVPLAVLVPAALVARRRSLAVLAVATGVVVGPLMGFCLPWRRVLPAPTGTGLRLRVMTCNLHGRAADPRALAALVAESHPDVLALEEWAGWPADPPVAGPGWHVATDGELRLESRFPIRRQPDVIVNQGWSAGAAVRYDVLPPGGGGPVPVVVVHLASPHDSIRAALGRGPDAEVVGAGSLRDNLRSRRRQAIEVGRDAAAAGPRVVALGDFNMPCDSESFRALLSAPTAARLSDAFAGGGGLGFGWTYRVRWDAARIDHVLVGPAWRCRRCWVGPNVGSPHRPLLADLEPADPP